MLNNDTIRLNKFISESGLCSRREADTFIEQGMVLINGRKASVGTKVYPGDKVSVNGKKIEAKKEEEAVYLAFNKPPGITSTSESSVKDNIVDYIKYHIRIFPIGRLDKDSQGLIFLTSNGDIVNKILRAGNNHEKEYLVTVNKPITDAFIEAMANGVPILGTTTKKCFVQKESAIVFKIILVQGLNRQIRRMCEYLGYEVTRLERTRIMNVGLKGLPLGEWRELTSKELEGINRMVKNSVATEEASQSKNTKQNPPKKVAKKIVAKNNSNPDNRNRSSKSGVKKSASKNTNPGFKKSATGSASRGNSGRKSEGRNNRKSSSGRSGRGGKR
ncbi:MAG: 23S rRNA pseudouridine(2604) synthase RluF [Bacteroidota bacterium]|nr:23S rRNA pseudouridine(2604) synthase RluF [Bacteroidota bacterium]